MFKFIKRIIDFANKSINKFEPIKSKCLHDNVFAIAGYSAFFMILSAVPMIIFIVSVLQIRNISPEIIELAFQGIFSDAMLGYATDFFNQAYDSAVGISFVSLLVTLWSASQGMYAITNGLNRVYDSYENRNWLFLRLRAMLYTAAFLIVAILSIFIIILGKSLDDFLQVYLEKLPGIFSSIFRLRYIIIFLLLTLIFALIYRNFPAISKAEHREYRFKYQLPGAVLCSASWIVLALVISIYTGSFNGFSVYGVLTGVAAVMIWLYFCLVSLMICAEINYVYHGQIKGLSLSEAAKKCAGFIKSKLKRKK